MPKAATKERARKTAPRPQPKAKRIVKVDVALPGTFQSNEYGYNRNHKTTFNLHREDKKVTVTREDCNDIFTFTLDNMKLAVELLSEDIKVEPSD